MRTLEPAEEATIDGLGLIKIYKDNVGFFIFLKKTAETQAAAKLAAANLPPPPSEDLILSGLTALIKASSLFKDQMNKKKHRRYKFYNDYAEFLAIYMF